VKGTRRLSLSPLVTLAACASVPAAVLAVVGTRMVMPPMWLHFYGVGGTALAAALASIALTSAGVRRGDPRTVLAGTGFSVMAALLAVHGAMTPGVLVGMNGLIAISGATTLPAGAAILVFCDRPLRSPRAIPRLLALEATLVTAIAGLAVLVWRFPGLLPSLPAPKSPAALALLAFGLALFGVLALRAARTFVLTRRAADLAVVLGLALLASSVYSALVLDFMQLGWWIGHLTEVIGIVLVGSSVAYDLRRGRESRVLAGNLGVCEIVAAEEHFLGARVRALMVRLAEKDVSTEEHTRRVAWLAVRIGEELGLAPARLRRLAIGGLLHDIGKLSTPTDVLRKPAALDEREFALIKRHPESGRDLLVELGGFDDGVKRLVLDHHERLDGSGYPRGLGGDELDLETRILSVCDVYDALVSPRVYRGAWTSKRALALLAGDEKDGFDERCVEALRRVLGRGLQALPLAS
jgi:HD-GYP domain-containing protein (c-di-GMP phosphodiesterase class II)